MVQSHVMSEPAEMGIMHSRYGAPSSVRMIAQFGLHECAGLWAALSNLIATVGLAHPHSVGGLSSGTSWCSLADACSGPMRCPRRRLILASMSLAAVVIVALVRVCVSGWYVSGTRASHGWY